MLKDFGDTGTLGYTNMQSAHFAFYYILHIIQKSLLHFPSPASLLAPWTKGLVARGWLRGNNRRGSGVSRVAVILNF